MDKDLTQGSIKKHYFHYLGAALGSAMISCIYGLVDAAVVGQYQGPQGTAALSIVMPIWTILYSLGLLIGIGGSVNYSYYKAQGKTDKANAYFTLSLILTSIVAILCWFGLTAFDDALLRFFGADDILLPLAKNYLRPVQYVIPAYPFTQMLAAFLKMITHRDWQLLQHYSAVSLMCSVIFILCSDLIWECLVRVLQPPLAQRCPL